MRSEADLDPEQLRIVEEMIACPEAIVVVGLGGGKTIMALTAIVKLGLPAMVVGTKRIVEHTWPTEIEKWAHTNTLSYASASGGMKRMERALEDDPDVVGINYESLSRWYSIGGSAGRAVLIFDEVSKMGNASTARFRSHKRYMNGFERRYGLTATPAANSYLGLFGQSASVISASPLGRNLTAFRRAYTTPQHRGMYTEYTVNDAQKRMIERDLRPWIISSNQEYVSETPPARVIDEEVEWGSRSSLGEYRAMERELLLTLESTPTPVANAGVASQKCRQLATGFVYDEDGKAHYRDLAKLEAVVELCANAGDDPVLLFYQFKAEQEFLLNAIPGAEMGTAENLERFNQGEIPVMLLHPRSGGHGLNLQGRCSTVVWSSLPWSMEEYMQANGRVDRRGQERQVRIYRFLREGTVDYDITSRLEQKWTTQEDLLSRLRQRLE